MKKKEIAESRVLEKVSLKKQVRGSIEKIRKMKLEEVREVVGGSKPSPRNGETEK